MQSITGFHDNSAMSPKLWEYNPGNLPLPFFTYVLESEVMTMPTSKVVGLTGTSAMSTEERSVITELIQQDDVVLEIGTLHGVTIADIAMKRPQATFVSLDVFRVVKDVGDGNYVSWWKNHQPNQHLFIGTAQDAEGFFRLRAFDVVFVDAGHTYEDCARDLISASVLVKAAGKLLVHDYHRTDLKHLAGVSKAVDDFCAASPWQQVNTVEPGHCTAVLEMCAVDTV